MDTIKRVILLPALRQLVNAARSERGRLPLESTERIFYLGVEAAAQGILHPETLVGRTEDWLAHETSAFREGYAAMLAEITAVVTTGNVPIQLALPEPPRRFVGTGGTDA
jgi:hypothetical protein